MSTYTRFLPDERRRDIIVYLVAQEWPTEQATATQHWQDTDDDALLDAYNYARR